VAAQARFELTTKRTLRLAKDALKGFGSNPWTVTRSSNGTSVNLAGGDLWAADSDLVSNAAGSNHSWIVLRNSVLGVELCFDMSNSAISITIVFSWSAGFTGGTVTTRPTATDERVLISNSSWITNNNDIALRWSVQHSTDGLATRIWVAGAATAQAHMVIERPANPSTGWSNPCVVFCGTGFPSMSSWTSVGALRYGTVASTVWVGVEGSNNAGPTDTTHGQIANEITGEWPFWPLGVIGATVGARGRHGSLTDLWFGSNSMSNGDAYPADGTNQFVQFGLAITPWNGGPVNLS
jgi:hypothetical protein